jgi:hypothetical protein
LYTSADAHFPNRSIPVLTIHAATPPGERQRGRPNEPDFVAILVILIRLEAQKTDIVVTINVPHMPGSYDKDAVDPQDGKFGPLLESAQKVEEQVLDSFEVKDFGLFVDEE